MCRKDISQEGYKHFAPTPGQPRHLATNSTSTCKLYIEGYIGHEADADNAEKEVIERMRLDNPNLNEEEVRIGTGTKKGHKAKANTVRLHPFDGHPGDRRFHRFPGPVPRHPAPAAPRVLDAPGNRIPEFMPQPYNGGLRPAEDLDQGINLPRIIANGQEAGIIAPIDHGATLTMARRVHEAVADQHARARRRLERARAIVTGNQDDDQLGGNWGAGMGINLDGAFDYEPVRHPPRAYTNPQLDWHRIHDHHFTQPVAGDRSTGVFIPPNRPALQHNVPNPPFDGLTWREQKLFEEPDEARSVYEDALEMLQ